MAIACKIDPLGIHDIPGGYKRINYIKTTASGSQWIDTNQDGKGIFLDGLSARYDITLVTHIRVFGSVHFLRALFAAKINNDTGAILYCGASQDRTRDPNEYYPGPYYTQENIGHTRSYSRFTNNGIVPNITISDKPNTIVLSNVDHLIIDSLPGVGVATGGWICAHSSESGAVRFFKNVRRNKNDVGGTPVEAGTSLYECIIKKDGIKIAHFVPCLDNTGRPCLFDIISRNTYYNSGTGEFLWG